MSANNYELELAERIVDALERIAKAQEEAARTLAKIERTRDRAR
jgi:hypothetical protein